MTSPDTDVPVSLSKESRLLSAASASLSPMPEHIRELESRRLEGLASLREWETEREISAISWSGRVEEIRIQLGKIMENGIKETHGACVFLENRIEIDLKYAQALEALPDEPSNWNEYSGRTGKLLHDFNEATQTTLIDKGLKEVEVEYKGRMEEILRSLDGVVEECQSAEEAVAEAWKQHEGLFMSRFTHGAGASATDRWSSERNYREAVSAAAQRRSMVEGYLVSSVAIANKAEAWREQNTTSVVRHWLTKQYQLWLHVSSAAQDQQRVLTEELTEAALSATGQVDSVAALRISPTRKDSILASPRAEDSTREKSVIATSPEMVCLMRMLGPAPPPRSTTTEESRERSAEPRKAGITASKEVADNDITETSLIHRPFFHNLREDSRRAGGRDTCPRTGLVIHSAIVSAAPSSKSGGWFSGGPKWTTQEVTVTADAYIYLQAEHQDDAKPMTALLTQSTVTLASEGDSEILTIKPVKQSGMFTSAPKSLQLKLPLDGQHLGGRWLELLHRVQCQARNREELLAATVGRKSSKSHRDSNHRSSDDGNMEAPDHQQNKA